MEALCSTEMLLTMYQNTQYHIPEGNNHVAFFFIPIYILASFIYSPSTFSHYLFICHSFMIYFYLCFMYVFNFIFLSIPFLFLPFFEFILSLCCFCHNIYHFSSSNGHAFFLLSESTTAVNSFAFNAGIYCNSFICILQSKTNPYFGSDLILH
jgi:hypothetical protein